VSPKYWKRILCRQDIDTAGKEAGPKGAAAAAGAAVEAAEAVAAAGAAIDVVTAAVAAVVAVADRTYMLCVGHYPLYIRACPLLRRFL
jgi:hypothetical protein